MVEKAEYRTIAGRLYTDAGVFPKAFAESYAKANRSRGWWVRLEKLKPPFVKNSKGQNCTYRVWLGGSNRPWPKAKK